MTANTNHLPLEAFHRTAARVPAYRMLLAEAGLRASEIRSVEDFARLPVLDKRNTFQRFGIDELCMDGELGSLGSVLTSSGYSGFFAFGLSDANSLHATVKWIDDLLDSLFSVRSRPTLLINCLPMGVKVHTQACTLAETSVRPDMVVGLVKAFGRHYAQIILVGETAFIKHTLELGQAACVDWRSHLVQVIVVGEEPLAENARKYLEGVLGIDVRRPETGVVFSSMGVAELGLNLFSEVPPLAPLILLRRELHENRELRNAVLGPAEWVPSLFTYDPHRMFVEFDTGGRLILTTLDALLRLPLIRYATGDHGKVLRLPSSVRPAIEAAGVSWEMLESLPIVMIHGRGQHALAGQQPVYPEVVKEGIYHDKELVSLTTANFRLVSGPERVRVRIQLSPDVLPDSKIEQRFADAISRHVQAPIEVVCESYQSFTSGMTLDYERKFDYLGR